MKLNIRHLPILGVLALAAVGAGSCTDKIAFGNAFLEKAPGGTVTADTVFNNPEYTRYFLNQIYAYQYYNLPTGSANGNPQWYNYWKGIPDLLDDCWTANSTTPGTARAYYTEVVTSNADGYGNYNIYPYNNMRVWENVRACNLLLERINDVPDMSDEEKMQIADQARCLMAYTYYMTFRYYGGLPIVNTAFVGSETEYQGRSTAKETIDFMVGLLDEVISHNVLPWSQGDDAISENGHWTLAGAMGLKIQILQFAASPLLNSAQPYYEGKYTMENPEFVWLGGYDQQRWVDLRNACEQFFSRNGGLDGTYHLNHPTEETQEGYAFAFRSGYMYQDSPEVVHSIRVSNNAHANNYVWFNLGFGSDSDTGGGTRVEYGPTHEYACMFPWADGTPFNWDESAAADPESDKSLKHMFIKGDVEKGQHDLQNVKYTRDPRLYETMACNGQRAVIEWNGGSRSGQMYEGYVGGTTAQQNPVTGEGMWGTGYRMLRYLAGRAFDRQYPQWCPILYSDLCLTYAEAIMQSGGQLTDAIKYVDAVRARVGLKGIAECNPDKNLTSNKDNLLEEILRERACELGFQLSRYFDMIRYKRADLFERPLHGLRMYRMLDGKRIEEKWYDGDRKDTKITEDNPRFYEPTDFEYEVYTITNGKRNWWTTGFDVKYYFQAFPITEVNKGYGLDQNPGW